MQIKDILLRNLVCRWKRLSVVSNGAKLGGGIRGIGNRVNSCKKGFKHWYKIRSLRQLTSHGEATFLNLHKSHTRIDGWYPQREQKKSYRWSLRASKWRYAFLNTLSHTAIFSVLRSTAAVLPIAVFSWKKEGQTRTINHEIVETSLYLSLFNGHFTFPLKKTLPVNFLIIDYPIPSEQALINSW